MKILVVVVVALLAVAAVICICVHHDAVARASLARRLNSALGRMRMPGKFILLMVGVCCLPMLASASNSREAVLAHHSGPHGAPSINRQDKSISIEICADTCDYFIARRMRSEDEVWDMVFLHQSFFSSDIAARSFRAKNAAHVSFVLATYFRPCSKYPQDATRASCIVKYLARRNGISYALVRYDEGYRCEIAGDLLVPSTFHGKGKCARPKKAP